MAYFAVTTAHGRGWDPSRGIRQQDAWDAHAAFMDALVAEGFVVIGGPLGSGDRALLAVEAADEQQVRSRLAADPWEPMDLLHVDTVEPWSLWLDGRNRAT